MAPAATLCAGTIMRQSQNANPQLDEHVRRALNKIKRPSTAEEIAELLNQELSPSDSPFSEEDVDRWLRNSGEQVLRLYWLRNRPRRSIGYCRSVSESIGFSGRQQIPKSFQIRNHGLLARVSSCLRFAAETSLALRGLMSGASNISSSCSMSSIMRLTSIRDSIANQLSSQPNEGHSLH